MQHSYPPAVRFALRDALVDEVAQSTVNLAFPKSFRKPSTNQTTFTWHAGTPFNCLLPALSTATNATGTSQPTLLLQASPQTAQRCRVKLNHNAQASNKYLHILSRRHKSSQDKINLHARGQSARLIQCSLRHTSCSSIHVRSFKRQQLEATTWRQVTYMGQRLAKPC